MTIDPFHHVRRDQDPMFAEFGARLRRALVTGDVAGVTACMLDEDSFGLHQGRTRSQYIAYEVDEFTVKAARFGLNVEGPTTMVEWGHGQAFSLMFANDDGLMLFENWFKLVLTPDGPRLAGNGAWAIWQSKMRMSRVMQGDKVLEERQSRAINIKPLNGEHLLNIVVLDRNVVNPRHVHFDLEDVHGGQFLACQFDYENDHHHTAWTRARILFEDQNGKKMFKNLAGDLRGDDHPFFIPNQFPSLERNEDGSYWLVFNPESHPAEVTAVGQAHAFELRWKYPTSPKLALPSRPQEIIVSDPIGHDWVVRWTD